MAQLRRVLCKTIETVSQDRKTIIQATEISNAAGKIISSIKVQLEYCHMRKETPIIDFIDDKTETDS